MTSIGVLRLVTATGMHSIQVDAAAGLAMAIHMGIPIFMDGEFSPAESDGTGHIHNVHDHGAAGKAALDQVDDNAEIEPGVTTPIPRVFQDLIDGLGMPESGDRPDGGTTPD